MLSKIKSKPKKNNKILYLCLGFFILTVILQWDSVSAQYVYNTMENIPGYEGTLAGPNQFKSMVENIYRFGIWTVGLAALLMISIGGFMYMTSAGNTSKAGTAKGIITDAIYGLIVALFAWLLLFVINPDLTRVGITITPLSINFNPGGGNTNPVSSQSGTPTSTTRPTPAQTPSQRCVEPASGPCSVSRLNGVSSCFGSNVNRASAICNGESANGSLLTSTVDRCRPSGDSVSFGLFQINISAHQMRDSSGNNLNCPSAFSSTYTGSNRNCTVVNRSLYEQCRNAALNPSTNVEKACQISGNGANWNQWGFNTRACHF